MIKELQKTDESLRMDSIILTPEMIGEISFLQTGGNGPDHIFKKEDFENSYIEDQNERIIKIMDFIIMLSGGTEPTDKTEYLNHLDTLRFVKIHFDTFKCPID